MSRPKAAIGLVLAAAVSVPLSAKGGARVLTLDEALQRAAEASPLVRRARAESRTVESHAVGAGLHLPANPVVAVQAGAFRVGGVAQQPSGSGLQWGAHLEQSFEIAGQRGARLDEVERMAETAHLRERVALAETHARTRVAYLAGVLAGQLVATEALRSDLARDMVTSVKARVQAGAGSDIEVSLAEAEHGRSRAARLDAEGDRAVRLAQLRTLIAAPADEPLQLSMPLVQTTDPPPLAELLARALQHRAELRALASEAGELSAAIARLGREAIPNLSVFVDLVSQPEVAGQPAQLYAGGGLAFALPLFRRNQGELAIAHAERRRVGDESELAERLVAEEVSLARAEVAKRREQFALYEEVIVPAATRQAALLVEGWRAGKFDLFRVIAAMREEAAARRERIATLAALWEAEIALDRAVGTP